MLFWEPKIKRESPRLLAYQMESPDFFRNAYKHALIPLPQGNIKYMVPMFFQQCASPGINYKSQLPCHSFLSGIALPLYNVLV